MTAIVMPLLAVVLALAPAEAYNRGNALYAQKDYEGAARAYREALEAGPSAAVHYNLANALFKSGEIGRAILNYRRARFLEPRDPDIRANLTFARNYRVDKVLTVPGPIARALDGIFHRLSLREASLLAAVFFACSGLLLSIWIVRRWRVTLWLAMASLLLFVFCFVTRQTWIGEIDAQPAVVVVPEVDAMSGPGEEFKPILLLHDGTEVRIRETRGDHLLVQVPGGSGGWITGDAVERVYGGDRVASKGGAHIEPARPLTVPRGDSAAVSGERPAGR